MPGREAPLTLFLLHFLGGSARAWSRVIERLPGSLRCVTLDLPGFGAASGTGGYSVEEMAGLVARAIRAEAPGRWVLAGHSMGAKVAAVLARRAEDGEAGLDGLAGLVLLAGSPPGPEPMEEEQRRTMLGRLSGDAEARHADAHAYVSENVAGSLDREMHGQAVEDVLRARPEAWRAWLDQGSREDWSDRVGTLRTPTLVVAGAEDEALGPDAQQRHMLPHFARGRLEVLAGARHLLPMEQPDAVAALIARHVEQVRAPAAP